MIVERLYAALLIAFPRRFRRTAEPMRQAFRARYADAIRQRRRLPFLARTLVDVLGNAALERVAATRNWLLFPDAPAQLACVSRSDDPCPGRLSRPMCATRCACCTRAGVYRPHRPRARPGHRCQQRHLQRRPWRADEAAAVRGARAAADDLERQHARRRASVSDVAGRFHRHAGFGADARSDGSDAVLPDQLDSANQRGCRSVQPRRRHARHVRSARTPGRARPHVPRVRSRQRAVLILADGYWRRRFGADPDIIGRQLRFPIGR